MTHDPLNPDILSLIICDQIITDRMTGKQSIIGMFSMMGQQVVVKAQVFAGGRGKAGFVKLCDSADQVRQSAISSFLTIGGVTGGPKPSPEGCWLPPRPPRPYTGSLLLRRNSLTVESTERRVSDSAPRSGPRSRDPGRVVRSA